MEVYVDDMMVKTVNTHDHIQDLEEVFAIIRHYQMSRNPKKCIWGDIQQVLRLPCVFQGN